MASHAAVSQGGGDTSLRAAPLVGSAGQEYVQTMLSTDNPVTAIQDIQAHGSLSDPRCHPLLLLLDQLGQSRAEAHRHVVHSAVQELLSRIDALSPDRLLRLLEVTFPFIGLSELRAVPLAVLARLRPVPATFLKQLAVDRELFWELPPGVQRQAWELDRKLLHAHALPLIAAYTYETATAMQGLNMDEPPPLGAGAAGTAGASAARLPQLARRNLRAGSAALRRLTAMVEGSHTVYRGVVQLCVARFREGGTIYVGMKEAALCALRSQLLMSMHDLGEAEICSAEPCHKLAWTLDACIKDGHLDKRRLKDLANFFSALEAAAPRRPPRPRSGGASGAGVRKPRARPTDRSGGGGSAMRRDREADAESAGAPGAALVEDPGLVLCDAGMVMRDPAALHLVLHQVVRCLERCVANEAVPKDDPQLCFLSRLLTLAAACRAMLRDSHFVFPEVNPEVLDTLYPLLADYILEASLREGEEEVEDDPAAAEEADGPPPPALVQVQVRDELSRRVVQTYALERLAAGDLVTGRQLLRALAACLDRLSDAAIPEFAPFAFTLARRMASLHAAGRVGPDHSLWQVAVDAVLLRLVDAETEVHEEVLRLLLAAAPAMGPARLGACLAATLAASKRSRKLHKQRAAGEEALPLGGFGLGEGSLGGGYTSEGPWGGGGEGGTTAAARGADGVRGTYALFVHKQPGLNPSLAPALFQYLESAG